MSLCIYGRYNDDRRDTGSMGRNSGHSHLHCRKGSTMKDIILHSGALTVELNSDDTVTLHNAGDCPTLDDIARQKAYSAYMAPLDPPVWEDVSK